ncbi:MAG: hypothetical protein NZ960_00540 [Candidatus Kapabacteria bacterium]|nr:hypothetical protein [Candidatus Kapabacteria bacterium]MDW8011515.1 hypothetical protein [Bacteroidota bacterium]
MVTEPHSQRLSDSAGWYCAFFERATLTWLVLDLATSEVVGALHRAA